jgi:hypothetical protein
VWLFFGIFGSFINSASRSLLPKIIEDPKTIQFIRMFLLVFIIYLIVGIIRLKSTQRIISIIIMSIVSIYQTYAIMTFLMLDYFSKKTLIIICWKLFLIIPSIIAIIYLSRKKFREYAKEFLEIKKQEAMQKFVQKKSEKNFVKMRNK